jgi:hypothetical protein
MPTDNQSPEITHNENLPFFEFKNDVLLLPEHIEGDSQDSEFFAHGTSDDDLQF